MLSAGLDPRDTHHRGLFCQQLVSGPVLREDHVWRSATSRGTLFAALEQCPEALLHRCSHGGVHGVQHELHLLDAGADSLSLDSAMMGIDKGQAFPHLFKSHRPVTLSSPLTRTESRVARDILVPSLEVPWSYPPDVFVRINPLIEDGFIEPYVTGEGWNQGDNASGDTYQVGELVVGGCLLHSQDIRISPGPAGIPINNLSFSNNRRLICTSLSDLVALTRVCTAATLAKKGLVHPEKLQFFALTTTDGTLRKEVVPVPFYGVLTSTACPQVVGIPLSADLLAPPALDALARDVARLHTRQQSVRVTPVLALRALWAYILAKFDYIALGVAVNPTHVLPLAIQVRAQYRQTLDLPCWTSTALMALPMAGGGGGKAVRAWSFGPLPTCWPPTHRPQARAAPRLRQRRCTSPPQIVPGGRGTMCTCVAQRTPGTCSSRSCWTHRQWT